MENTEDDCPKFVLGGSRFNQKIFYGRWRHFMDMIDPRTLLVNDRELRQACELLEKFKSGQLPEGITNQNLWEAQRTKQAIIHPDTGEKIFMPLRMSGFVPFGAPIVVGCLLPNQTLAATAFWQWLNQSHNACINYANRNASKPTPLSRFVVGYAGAVSSAVGIALGLRYVIARASALQPTVKLIVSKFVPFPATACASTLNVILMRNSELIDGIAITDEDGNYVATSRAAARKALIETSITRIILPAPVFLLPPIIMTLLERTSLLIRRPKLHLPFNALVCTLSFAFGLPIAIAVFPQISHIRREDLEGQLKNSLTQESFYYNKGL